MVSPETILNEFSKAQSPDPSPLNASIPVGPDTIDLRAFHGHTWPMYDMPLPEEATEDMAVMDSQQSIAVAAAVAVASSHFHDPNESPEAMEDEDDGESDAEDSDDESAQSEVEMVDSHCQCTISFDFLDPQWMLSEPTTSTKEQRAHFLQCQHDLLLWCVNYIESLDPSLIRKPNCKAALAQLKDEIAGDAKRDDALRRTSVLEYVKDSTNSMKARHLALSDEAAFRQKRQQENNAKLEQQLKDERIKMMSSTTTGGSDNKAFGDFQPPEKNYCAITEEGHGTGPEVGQEPKIQEKYFR
jgi:hypothetical protein